MLHPTTAIPMIPQSDTSLGNQLGWAYSYSERRTWQWMSVIFGMRSTIDAMAGFGWQMPWVKPPECVCEACPWQAKVPAGAQQQ